MAYNVKETIEKLKRIKPSSNAMQFLVNRLSDPTKYRGNHILQHNRDTVDIDKLSLLFSLIMEAGRFVLPKGDLGRNYLIGDYPVYGRIVDEYKKQAGTGTGNTIKKNIFPDLSRWGYLTKYVFKNGHFSIVNPFGRAQCTHIEASQMVNEFLTLSNSEKKIHLKNAFGSVNQDLIDAIVYIMVRCNGRISTFEMAAFVTYNNLELQGNLITQDVIIDLIKDYRTSLSSVEKFSLGETLKELKPPKKGNKKDKVDYPNLINESRQILEMLDVINYVEFDDEEDTALIKGYINDAEKFIKIRSSKPIKDYNNNHKTTSTPGYQHHHIIGFATAKNLDEVMQIDNWRNMLLIDGKTHDIITRSKNKYNKLIREASKVKLVSIVDNDFIELIPGENVLIDINHIEDLIEHNRSIWEMR